MGRFRGSLAQVSRSCGVLGATLDVWTTHTKGRGNDVAECGFVVQSEEWWKLGPEQVTTTVTPTFRVRPPNLRPVDTPKLPTLSLWRLSFQLVSLWTLTGGVWFAGRIYCLPFRPIFTVVPPFWPDLGVF